MKNQRKGQIEVERSEKLAQRRKNGIWYTIRNAFVRFFRRNNVESGSEIQVEVRSAVATALKGAAAAGLAVGGVMMAEGAEMDVYAEEPEQPSQQPAEPEQPSQQPAEPEQPSQQPAEPEQPSQQPAEPAAPAQQETQQPAAPEQTNQDANGTFTTNLVAYDETGKEYKGQDAENLKNEIDQTFDEVNGNKDTKLDDQENKSLFTRVTVVDGDVTTVTETTTTIRESISKGDGTTTTSSTTTEINENDPDYNVVKLDENGQQIFDSNGNPIHPYQKVETTVVVDDEEKVTREVEENTTTTTTTHISEDKPFTDSNPVETVTFESSSSDIMKVESDKSEKKATQEEVTKVNGIVKDSESADGGYQPNEDGTTKSKTTTENDSETTIIVKKSVVTNGSTSSPTEDIVDVAADEEVPTVTDKNGIVHRPDKKTVQTTETTGGTTKTEVTITTKTYTTETITVGGETTNKQDYSGKNILIVNGDGTISRASSDFATKVKDFMNKQNVTADFDLYADSLEEFKVGHIDGNVALNQLKVPLTLYIPDKVAAEKSDSENITLEYAKSSYSYIKTTTDNGEIRQTQSHQYDSQNNNKNVAFLIKGDQVVDRDPGTAGTEYSKKTISTDKDYNADGTVSNEYAETLTSISQRFRNFQKEVDITGNLDSISKAGAALIDGALTTVAEDTNKLRSVSNALGTLSSSDIIVANISASSLSEPLSALLQSLVRNNANGATILLNVAPDASKHVDIKDIWLNAQFEGPAAYNSKAAYLHWNFGDSTSVKINTEWAGNVIAPSAKMEVNAIQSGRAVAKSIYGDVEYHFGMSGNRVPGREETIRKESGETTETYYYTETAASSKKEEITNYHYEYDTVDKNSTSSKKSYTLSKKSDPSSSIEYKYRDQPTPDQPTPDNPTPDNPTPDNPTPDNPTPDNPTPETPTPDVPTPDVPTPEEPGDVLGATRTEEAPEEAQVLGATRAPEGGRVLGANRGRNAQTGDAATMMQDAAAAMAAAAGLAGYAGVSLKRKKKDKK